MRTVDPLFSPKKSNRRTIADPMIRSFLRALVFAGLMTLVAGSLPMHSGEIVTIHSGSKTITVSPGKPAAGSREMTAEKMAREMLGEHNSVRNRVGLPPLQWSPELAAYSQKWANKLVASNSTLHNSQSPYGENIIATGLGSTPAFVVAEWASESRDYTYKTNSCKGDCGHYTQLVWRATNKVGCAMAHNRQREVWVCSYDPAGNFLGERPY